MEIRVDINLLDFPLGWSVLEVTPWIIGKLKEKGVPVKGTLCFRGVKEGTLIRQEGSLETPNIITYIYRSDDEEGTACIQ